MDRSIHRKLVFWSIGFWVVSVSVLSLTILGIGRNEITNETRQRNVQLASVVSRDINSQISGILSDIRVFSRYLEVLGPDLESQAAAVLALRQSSSQRYRAVYYMNYDGGLLFHIAEPMEALLLVKSSAEIISRPAVPLDTRIKDTFLGTRGAMTYVSMSVSQESIMSLLPASECR